MTKKSKKNRNPAGEKQPAPESKPWLGMRTGLIVVGVVSLGLAIYITWTMAPGLGLGKALIWGLGFGLAMWGVFALALGFNRWVRGR